MAAKTFSWNITVDEVTYKIELTKNKVTVNGGEPVKLNKLKHQSKYPNMEYYIPVGSKEVVLNTRPAGEPVLTMDGRDCVTGEPFELNELPKWAWVFIVLHGLNFFLLIGGAIGGACFGGLSVLTTTIASNGEMSTGKRVGICVAIWLVASILELILAVVIADALYS